MQQGDTSNPYYQFYQPPLHNPSPIPNPNPIDPHAHGSWPATTSYASAPPVSGAGYTSAPAPAPSDHLNYASGYPPYPPSSDHIPVSNPTAPTGFQYPYDQSQPPFYSYDQNQAALSYAPPNPIPAPSPIPPYSAAPSSYAAPSAAPNHDNLYESAASLNRWGGYPDEGLGRYGGQGANGSRFSQQGFPDEGVYRYEGGKVVPYGARGTAGSKSSSETLFDDYGRPINLSKGGDSGGSRMPTKVVKAIPKADTEEDAKNGVQKYRVKLLSEGFGQNEMDVLCQIGLDGIRMLDPATSRTLRIYTLDTVTRWEVLDSYIFAFWAKTPVDIEAKRIRLKSNSYTTNTILDTVTAASVQLKEMGDRKESDYARSSEQQMERKKGLADWMNFIKPPIEEKDHWIPDEAVTKCTSCGTNFNAFVRKHHCRNCGEIYCDKCTQGRTPLNNDEEAQPVRVCDRCMAEVTHRLANAKEAARRSGSVRTHEDLAKRLKEEMNKNAKSSSGSTPDRSSGRMREVACPTCTVHLQVQVPSSGSETIECSVCQHPFMRHRRLKKRGIEGLR
ncbi:hypothetical protein V2J09_016244 [Rumex salicifolius]